MRLPQVTFTKLPKLSLQKHELFIVVFVLVVLSLLTLYQVFKTSQDRSLLNKNLSQKESLVESLNTQVKNLLKENTNIKSEDSKKQLETIKNVIEKYETVKDKTARYKSQGIDVNSVEGQLATVVDDILSAKYSDADSLLTNLDSSLEALLKAKQTADAAAKSSSSVGNCTISSSGYCRTSVKASSGTFTVDVVTAILGSISVITDTANSSDCTDQCPTKSLSSYVQSNGGSAGINGTYFCPPDYSSCSGKVSSYDFPVYNTNLSKWINQDKLSWTNRAMFAFTSSSAVFYPQTNSYTSLSGIRAAIANFPGLVHNGANIVGNYSLTSAQGTKGNRGGVATKGGTIYLVIAKSATVSDLANVMIALGVDDALNIDGGGSSALIYNGSYKVGPGRSLPNALILK